MSRRFVTLLLFASLLVGCSGGSVSDAETSIPTSAGSGVVTVGNVALTDRQQEMVEVTDQYLAAWRSLDPAAVTAFFAPDGKLESILYEDEFRVSDSTLTERVQAAMNAFDMASLERVGPLLVDGDMVYSVAKAGSSQFSSLLVFTVTGPVRLVRHISLNS
jgi:hypothetical protein